MVAIAVEMTIKSGTVRPTVQSPSIAGAADNLKCPTNAREIWISESNSCKSDHAHLGSILLQDALGRKYEPTAKRSQHHAARLRVRT